MTTISGTTAVTMVRKVRRPRGSAVCTLSRPTRVIEDGTRYRTIGSLQALALAIGASLAVVGLIYTAL